jgi:two-component system, NtrC family, response regulator GlrR
MESLNVFLIDMNRTSRSPLAQSLRNIFESAGEQKVHVFESSSTSGDVFLSGRNPSKDGQQSPPDIVFLYIATGYGEVERALIRTLSREPGSVPVIAVMEDGGAEEMIELLKLGVVDFLTPPIRSVDVLPRMWRLIEHVRKKRTLMERLKETSGLRQIIGASPAITAEILKIPFMAGCDSSVLISGETGTGKEMFARAIHYLGPRAGEPFMPVNCGAIPVELVENELFGHMRGAYTSANTSEHGLISEADGGTLFLDEIDCLPLPAQVKLLRFLQEKEYRQLGSAKTRRADVRVIAAANSSLEGAVRKGSFRSDLFYRVNIIPLGLPALRERREDIPLLAHHFVDHYSLEFNKEIDDIAPEAVQKLLLYDWPGNVRELQNVIERAVVFSSHSVLQKGDINLPHAEHAGPAFSFQEAKAKVIMQFEKNYINGLLMAHRGNITQAAQVAGKNRRAFWELIRKHEIDVRQYRTLS